MEKLITHVSVGVSDIDRSSHFYDCVLATLGINRCHEIPGEAIAYGDDCEFWIVLPDNETLAAHPGNGVHIAFSAKLQTMVDDFYDTAISNGGKCSGMPGLRDHYTPGYYAAFVKDPDGNKIEAVHYAN